MQELFKSTRRFIFLMALFILVEIIFSLFIMLQRGTMEQMVGPVFVDEKVLGSDAEFRILSFDWEIP
ncbi:MAG TPA: hypothetical protein VIE65_05095, partial [Methylobacter sp.]